MTPDHEPTPSRPIEPPQTGKSWVTPTLTRYGKVPEESQPRAARLVFVS